MESAGSKIKKIRQELGLSLEEVQKKTKIHLNILKAIEGDSLTDLSPIYLRSFLKIYCKFLGQDPKEYISDYKERQSTIQDIGTTKDAPQQRLEKSPSLLKAASWKLGSIRPTRKIKRLFVFIFLAVLLSVGLFNLGKFISYRRSRPKQAKTAKVTARPPVAQTKIMPKAGSRRDTEESVKKYTITGKKDNILGIRLIIRAKENCWILLKADGHVLFQRVLEKGRFESWQAKDRIELSLGNAAAVELEVNGQLFSNLGRRGQARKNIVITKEGFNIGK